MSSVTRMGQQGPDAELVQDTIPTKWSLSVIVVSCRVLVSRFKARSGQILWERFRCELKDSHNIILE